jgi:calcium-dependent protein kinase
LDHPNICRLKEWFVDEKYYCLVQDLCEGGELFDQIVNNGGLKEAQARMIIKRMLSVIQYCHDMGIMHRDLKPENILLEKNLSPDTIKIIDFGGAKLFDASQEKFQVEKIGTPYYIAPEVLDKNYNQKCDVWSIGVISFMLLCGKTPFYGNDTKI